MKRLSITCYCLLLLLGCSSEVAVDGELFVVTKGAGNYKLGAVPIKAYLKSDFNSQIEAGKSKVSAKIAEAVKAGAECRDRSSMYWGSVLTEQLNECRMAEEGIVFPAFDEVLASAMPKATSTTNADGKFTLKLPTKGEYVIVARAQRSAGGSDESYVFLKPFQSGGNEQNVIISNGDLVEPFAVSAMMK